MVSCKSRFSHESHVNREYVCLSVCVKRACLSVLGRSWGVLERSGCHLRAILERSWPSWRDLGASSGDLGVSGVDLGTSLGDLGAILGAQERPTAAGGGGRRPQGGTP